MVTNPQTSTNVDEIADGIFRINTPIEIPGPGFCFNQYLIRDDEPLLFHTGPRKLFPHGPRRRVAAVMPVERLRYVGLSHFEADECGALNQFLAAAPRADAAVQPDRRDGLDQRPGRPAPRAPWPTARRSRSAATRSDWIDTPHLPHGWECGYLFEESTGDPLLRRPLHAAAARRRPRSPRPTSSARARRFARPLDYFAHTRDTDAPLERLARSKPTTLACMHGSAWRGDGGALIRRWRKRYLFRVEMPRILPVER